MPKKLDLEGEKEAGIEADERLGERMLEEGARTEGKAKEDEEVADERKRIEILKLFAKEVLKKYGGIIRSIVLFGSTARKQFRGESDIDVFVIIDDTRQPITPALKMQLEDDMELISRDLSKHLSIQQPYTLTEFWRLVREGHPIIFNFIREGIPIYDKDIFMPIKRLLQMGEIRPSKEAVEKFIERGPKRIKRVENAKMYMVVEDLYYSMLESAQAVLMFLGHAPPRPVDASNVLRKTLVETKMLTEDYVNFLEDIINLRKEVEHKRVNEVSGADLDKWIDKADKFVKRMEDLIVGIEVMKRENMVDKSHAIMTETVLTVLEALGHKPAKTDSMEDLIRRHLIDPGFMPDTYLQVYRDLNRMRKTVKEGKVTDLDKKDILMNREYVRKFIREASKILKKKGIEGIKEPKE